MLIVPGDSWFFAKLLTGGRLHKINGGTALRIPSRFMRESLVEGP